MDSFAGMRAWYSPIATLDLWFVWSAFFLLFFLLVQFMSPSNPPSRPERSLSEAIQVLGKTVLYVAPVFAFAFGVARLRARYFPMVSVALGQGVRRHGTEEQVRWTVVVGLVVGLVGSAIYARLSGT